jgi:hypothetical protein
MPEGVMFYYQGEMLTVYFSNPKACLPVRASNGEIQLAVWGRRKTHGRLGRFKFDLSRKMEPVYA